MDNEVYVEGTINVKNTIQDISDDESLLRYIARFRSVDNLYNHSVTARKFFNRLYATSKSLVADFYNADEHERKSGKIWTSDDITEGDIEKVLCCGTPVNHDGNLLKQSASTLNKFFNNKRLSRQHITALLTETVSIDRFDLITLNFFIFSQDKKYADDSKNRYIAFTDSTNEILNECMMGQLYIANPYECFLLMCILSDCPLATYADVWEMSFEI